jgi:hypothetical protein
VQILKFFALKNAGFVSFLAQGFFPESRSRWDCWNNHLRGTVE